MVERGEEMVDDVEETEEDGARVGGGLDVEVVEVSSYSETDGRKEDGADDDVDLSERCEGE